MSKIDELKAKMHMAAMKYQEDREAKRHDAQALDEMDDLLDAIRPEMEQNAKRRREQDAMGEANLRRYCRTVSAAKVLTFCGGAN